MIEFNSPWSNTNLLVISTTAKTSVRYKILIVTVTYNFIMLSNPLCFCLHFLILWTSYVMFLCQLRLILRKLTSHTTSKKQNQLTQLLKNKINLDTFFILALPFSSKFLVSCFTLIFYSVKIEEETKKNRSRNS